MRLKIIILLLAVTAFLVSLIIQTADKPSWTSQNKVNSLEYFARNSKNFCEDQQNIVNKLLAQDNPTSYIQKSSGSDKEYLELWKFLFMRQNGISEEYFNSHIRIMSHKYYDGIHNKLNGDNEYFEVYYFYILDWVNIFQSNRFTTDQPIEKIKELFSNSNAPDIENPKNIYYNSLNFIGDIKINGSLVQPISCQLILQKLAEVGKDLAPQSFDFQRKGMVLFADNVEKNCFSGNKKGYSYTEINVISGSAGFGSWRECPM